MNAGSIAPQFADVTDKYRYKRFTTSLLFRDLRFRRDAAAPGDAIPEFELITTAGPGSVVGRVSHGYAGARRNTLLTAVA